MPRYEGYECPVCKRAFEEGDDIVTCPECGTPHHRECYDLVGKCVNSGLHSSGFEFDTKPIETKKDESAKTIVGQYYTPNKDDDSDKEQSTNTPVISINISTENEYTKSNEEINGNAIADVAATIRTNIPRYITRFRDMEKKNKKTGWNWGAFFFGSLYYLFRKMYKQGVLFMCVFATLIFGSDTLMYKYAPLYVNAVMDMAEKYYNKQAFDPSALITADYSKAAMIVYITIGILLVIRIIEAMFADYFYMTTVEDIIDKMKKSLEENMSFSVSPMLGQDSNLSQEQMRRMYLARRGGVSFFAPMIAVLILETVMQFLL